MSNSQTKEIFKQAMRLNMKYYSGLFDVTRDYLASLRDLAEQGADKSEKSAPVPTSKPATPAVQPLILAAPAGKMAEARFSVTNSTGQELAADAELSDSLKAAGVKAEPAGRLVGHGENAVFTLSAKPTSKMRVEEDIHGTLSVRPFGNRDIPVVLRRLPAKAKRKAKKS